METLILLLDSFATGSASPTPWAVGTFRGAGVCSSGCCPPCRCQGPGLAPYHNDDFGIVTRTPGEWSGIQIPFQHSIRERFIAWCRSYRISERLLRGYRGPLQREGYPRPVEM